MAVFTKNIKLEFLSAADKIEKWAEPINDNLIKIDALGTEIVAAMLPFASLREAIEKNAGTNVDSTSIFFPDNISLPDVGDGVKRKLTDVISQIANNKMSVDNPAVRTGTMKLLSGSSGMPALSFGTSYDAYISGGNLIFAKGNVAQMTLVDKGIQVPETNDFNGESVVNVSFLKSKGLQAAWAGAGLKYTGAPTQYLEVIGNKLKAIKVDATNGVEMTWDDLVRTSVIKLSDFMIIQDPATKEFKATTKKEFLGQLLVKNYGAKFDPTTGSVIGDPLNSVLNPAGPSVPDGESPGNVSYVLSKNGNFDGKNVYAGQQVYWDTNTSKWTMTAEYVRLTSFTGADGVTITGDMVAGYGQYNAGLIRLDTSGMDTVAAASTSVQAGIKDLDSKKFNKTGGTISGDITVDDINVTAGHIVTIPTVPVNDHDAINKIYADAKFALLLGDKNNVFRVATPVGDDDAIPKKYVESLVAGTVSAYYTKVETDNKYALKAGNLSQVFSVAAPTNDEHAVNKKFTEDTYAKKQGDNTLVFQAANPVSPNDVVNKQYLEENVVSGQSAGKALKFTAGSPGVAPKIDVDIVDKMGLGFDVADENGKLMIDYPNLDRTLQVKPGDYIMVYDEVSGQILKVKKDDFLGTLTQSLRLRGSWNPNTNVILGDPLNPQVVGGSVTINIFSKTLAYAKDDFVFYAPFQPTWVLSNAYTKGDRVTKDGLDYVANDDIPVNTDFAEGTTGATWQFIDLYETYRAQEAIAPGPFDPSKWKKVAYSGSGPVGLAGDNTSGFAYSVQADGQFDLNATGTSTPMLAGDEIVWTGSAWILVPDAQAVKQVFGRTGPVIAAPGDYKADQITYTRDTGKTDISGQTTDVQIAINELDDKKVSTTKNQTISGNKTFSGNTTFTVAPKVPSKPLTPADDDLITQAYVSKLLADKEYITRVYNTAAGKPINWNIGQSTIGMTGTIFTAGAESEVYVDGIQKLAVKGNSTLEVEDNSRIVLGNSTTLVTDVVMQQFKGKFALQTNASMEAEGKINILYTPTDDDDAVPKKWVEDKIAAAQTSYTKAQSDAKYYLKTGGAVDGWGTFKSTATENWALKILDTSGANQTWFRTMGANEFLIYNGDGQPVLSTGSSQVEIGNAQRNIKTAGMLEAARGIELPGGQIINTGGTLATAGDTQLAMSSKVIGGKLYAGFWGNVINQTGNQTSADLLEANSFLLNSDIWELKGKRFIVSTTEGAHCAVVPTEDTHLVNKKFIDDKAFVDAGPADTKLYVRKNRAWSELVIPAPSYWALPDLPQQLKDIVENATVSAADTGDQKIYKQLQLFAKGIGQSAMKFYSGDRQAAGTELMELRANSATEAQFRQSTGISLLSGVSAAGDLRLDCNNTSSAVRLNSSGEIVIQLTGNNSKNIRINGDNGARTGTKYTNIIMKGGKGGTDIRGFKLVGVDSGTTSLEFNPGHSLLDGQAGKQMQIIPENQVADAFYYDSTNTRWNFRKLPRMATNTLNVTPTQPEEFITKKYLDSVTSSLGVAAGLEGQVYTMGASTWSGKYPQYMGTVKESSAINKIKIDEDASGGQILIQGSSAGDGTKANSQKFLNIKIDGTGTEQAVNSRAIYITNNSGAGGIILATKDAGLFDLTTGRLTANLKGTSENIIKAALSDVNIQSKRLILGSGNGEVSIVVDRTLTGFTLSDLPQIDKYQAISPRTQWDSTTYTSLGKAGYMGSCFWDEVYCNGIISQHTTTSQGVKIQTYAGAEWQTIATESNKRQRRAGGILLEIDQSLTPTAVETTANDANSIKLDNKTQYGAVMATARGANGQFFIQGGTNSAIQAAQAASTSGTQQTIISTGLLRLHSTSSVNMSGHSGISFTMQNETEYAGFGMSKITNAADNYNGALPTTGKNLMLVPTTVDMGRSIQIGSGNGAQMRFAGLFVRGLDIGESGSLTTTNAENGRGIAMVGATPKWAAAQASAVSDHYPRGGILIGIRGDGAETASDARRIQVINESNNGRIDIYAQPNIANGNNSTINIIQGKSAASSPNAGIRIAGSGLVEISSANSNVTVQAQAAGSSFAVNVGSEAQPQILVTKTTTTIRNLYSDVISTSSVAATGEISGLSLQAGGNGITSTGAVQINNSSPTLWLQDTDHKSAAIHVNSNICYILRSAAANGTSHDSGPNGRHPMTLSLDTGDVVFSGNVTTYSDIRLKRDVQDLSYGLKEIMKLRPISYKRVGTDTDRLEVGFIAQEVRDVIPEIVHEQQDDQKTLTMSYDKMVAPLVRAIQEQQDMINKLMSRVEELEKGGV